MKLSDDEKAMFDGQEGPARQKAMEVLGRYGEALGAERLVDTNNVCGTIGGSTPFLRQFASRVNSLDAVFSEFSLDSAEPVEIPHVKAFSCHLIQSLDPTCWEVQGVEPAVYQMNIQAQEFAARIGVQLMNTCTPYLVGNVPVKGEHCAWMESSAVVHCNAVLGARTNTEGRESVGAAMLTGKIPYWGHHIDKNRVGTHLVRVDYQPQSILDWGLLGYHVGEVVQEKVPVFEGIRSVPNLVKLKHCGACGGLVRWCGDVPHHRHNAGSPLAETGFRKEKTA